MAVILITMQVDLSTDHLFLNFPGMQDFVEEYDVIGIEEGQFIDGLEAFCQDVVDNQGKIVIVAGLDATYQRKSFPMITNLIPLAEKVDKLLAVCMRCHSTDAVFSRRLVESDKLEVIGGSDTYESVCRKCWNEKK